MMCPHGVLQGLQARDDTAILRSVSGACIRMTFEKFADLN